MSNRYKKSGSQAILDATRCQTPFSGIQCDIRRKFMSAQPQVDPELVAVFDTMQETEAMVVQGLLTSAGIDSIISSLQAQQDVLPGVGGVVVQVSAAQAKEARQLIADYESAPPANAADVAQAAAEDKENPDS
jgi:hypothetical protein